MINSYPSNLQNSFEIQKTPQEFTSVIFHKPITVRQNCPICQKRLEIAIDPAHIAKQTHFPYPHIYLHGDPLHAIVLYIDAHHQVRGYDCVQSIQFDRTSETFSQILQHWSNPF